MRSQEAKVSPASDYYVYAPSALAARLYLYPTSVGYFYYEAGYWIRRNRFDSFLIMYISKGNCHITIPGKKLTARAGQFVLLDCYQPHSYGSAGSWDALWLHFDGRHGTILRKSPPAMDRFWIQRTLMLPFSSSRRFTTYSAPLLRFWRSNSQAISQSF